MPGWEERQAAFERAVVARPPLPYPTEPLSWLGALEPNGLAFIANRLMGLPPHSRWSSRADCLATLGHWLGSEDPESPRDRLRHDLLWRWMEAEARRGAEVWPEPVPDGSTAIEFVDDVPDGEWA